MKNTALLALLLLATASAALASGPSGPAPTATPMLVGDDPLLVTELMKCKVTEIREDGTIMVRDLGTDAPPHALPYSKKTAFRAQDKKAFGKKKIQADDLQVGHVLLVTLVAESGEIQRVKVLKDKEA